MPELPINVHAEEEHIRQKYAQRPAGDARYSLFNPGQLFMLQERERQVLRLLQRYGMQPLENRRILEIGCGDGLWLREFVKWGAQPENVTGVELLSDRADQAVRLCPQGVTIFRGSAARLNFENGRFHIVLQSTAFTSIQDDGLKRKIANEMVRVLNPDGIILWYDFRVNNPNNPDVTGVGKREIEDLFPGCDIDLSSITLLPPLLRRLAPWSWAACYVLGRVPWFRTHYLGAIRKRR